MFTLTRVALICSGLLLTSFANAAEQTRTVPAFKAINNKGAFSLVVEVGKTQNPPKAAFLGLATFEVFCHIGLLGWSSGCFGLRLHLVLA